MTEKTMRSKYDKNNNLIVMQSSDSEMEPLPSYPNGADLMHTRNEHNRSTHLNKSTTLNQKMESAMRRTILGIVMISGFCYIIYLGT
jgi:hypothetical protein